MGDTRVPHDLAGLELPVLFAACVLQICPVSRPFHGPLLTFVLLLPVSVPGYAALESPFWNQPQATCFFPQGAVVFLKMVQTK